MQESESPHQRNLRGGRCSEALACYSITKAAAKRQQLLVDTYNAQLIVESLSFARERGWFKLLAFCLMPDHYHLLIVLLEPEPLSDVIASINKFASRRMKRIRLDQEIWQDGYFDHRCRDADDVLERLTYIENNPVRAGLVVRPEFWQFSSANPAMHELLDRRWYFENS